MSLSQAVDETAASARTDRRYTTGTVLDVDPILHTCTVDVGAADVTGVPVYLQQVPFQPQTPPHAGDQVSLIYLTRSASSVQIAGSQLSGSNGQGTITSVGGAIRVEVSGGGAVGPEPNLNFIAGTNVTSITATDDPSNSRVDVTINAAGAGGTHALLDGAVDTDTVAHTPVAGDMIVASGTPRWTGLAIGTAGQVLTVVSGAPAWQTPGGGGGGSWTEQSVSGATTLTGSGPTVAICDNSSSGYTVSIPSGAGAAGNLFVIKRTVINSNHITIQVLSGGTVEGSGTLVLGVFLSAYGVQFESVILESNGTEYKVIGVVPVYTGSPQGPLTWNTTYQAGSYVLAGADVAVAADAAGGSFQITFPSPSAANVGRLVKVRKTSGGSNTVLCNCTAAISTEFDGGQASWLIGSGGSSANFAEFIVVDEAGTYTWRAFAWG